MHTLVLYYYRGLISMIFTNPDQVFNIRESQKFKSKHSKNLTLLRAHCVS